MEEGVPFKEKEKVSGTNQARQGIGPSRRMDVDPGAEALETGVHHPTEGRSHHIPQCILPGVNEKGVPFEEEKEEITPLEDTRDWAAFEEIDIEHPDSQVDKCIVPASSDFDVSPGVASLGTEVPHPTQGRCTRLPEQDVPGAFREGGSNNDEWQDEDEFTIQPHTEQPPIPPTIPPTVSATAELVNTAEEEKRRQDDINQALERQRQNAPRAEILPDRSRQWKLAGALLLVILIVVGIVLGVTLHPEPEPTLSPEALGDLLSSVSSDGGTALQNTSTPQNKAFNWLAANNTNLGTYTNITIIQCYALVTLYFSTNGEGWTHSDNWLSDLDVCGRWYQYDEKTIGCTSAGAVTELDLSNNNLKGNMPPEIGLLTSLSKFIILRKE